MLTKPVHVIWSGTFGKVVATDLGVLRSDCLSAVSAEDVASFPEARIRVLAAWRPVPRLCELLDEVSHESRCPFLPLISDATTLRLGPVIIPGKGSCWSCWIKRGRQHDPWVDRREALSQYYAVHPDKGPQGYLRPFAMMSAARLSAIINEIDAGSALGGYVWQVNMMTREITTCIAVGVHDCPRCGRQCPSATRSFAEMKEKLGYLWTEGGIDGR